MPNFTGNTTLPHVKANQSITVTDGSLTISGDVGSRTSIILKNSQSSSLNQSFGNSIVVIGNNVINGSAKHKLIVQGNVHERANITGRSHMEFRGYLSDHIKVNTLGNIIVKGNVGSNTTLDSTSGNISASNVGSNTTLNSMSGNISASNVGSNTTLKSMSGNISVLSLDPSATMETMSGTCYENDRQVNSRENRNDRIGNMAIGSRSTVFNMSNFRNFFSSGTTTIINGVLMNEVEQAVPTTSRMRTTNRNASHTSNENSMPVVLQSYIDDFKGESYQDAFKRLAVDVNDKYSFLSIFCIISQDIPNIPVSLNGRLYDWDSLKSQIETNGYTDPMTRETFTLKQVIPDRTTRDSLVGILKKEEEIHKADIATCSSPAFKR